MSPRGDPVWVVEEGPHLDRLQRNSWSDRSSIHKPDNYECHPVLNPMTVYRRVLVDKETRSGSTPL